MHSPMQPDRPKPFREPLQAAARDTLGQIIERATLLAALDHRLRQSLPPNLAAQCRLANIAGDRLVFLVSSPVWKTRLRLASDLVLSAALQAGFPARQLILKVATMQPVPAKPTPHLPLSSAVRRHLEAAACSLKDPELQAKFRQLAALDKAPSDLSS